MIHNPWMAVGIAWAIMAALMTALWLFQRLRNDAGIVDVGWAAGVAILAIFYAVTVDGHGPRRWFAGALCAAWGLRLAIYLFMNRVLSPHEDGRYAALRAMWGARAHLWFFVFFQMQASWAVLFSVPVLIVMTRPERALLVWDWIGVAVWILAVAGEALSDFQLARFRGQPQNRGKTCREGLWRYSRHPNYFFEFIHWWAYCAMAVGAPHGWITLLGPVIMLLFLYRITGIPYTEKQALKTRGEDYRDYQRTTSAFVPWFPRKAGRP